MEPDRDDQDGGALPPDLGRLDATFLVMGGIIGAGIFFAPYKVARELPSVAGVLGTWLLGGLAAITGALVFAELGALFPRTGGQYVFLRQAFGRRLAFFHGWLLLTVVSSGAIAVVAGVCILHVDALLASLRGGGGPVLGRTAQGIAAASIIAVFTWINIRGVKLGATTHNSLMVVKIAGLVGVIALGCVWRLSALGPSGLELAPRSGAGDAGTLARQGSLSIALLGALFSFGGMQNAASIAGEVRDARRVMPRAILTGTGLVLLLYLLLNAALVEILSVDGLAASPTPVAEAARRVLGPAGGEAAAAMVIVSTLGITHAITLMTPRVYHAMALDGILFDACTRLHPVHRTPHVAILLQSIFACVHIAFATWISDLDGISGLLDSLVFVDWSFFALTALGYFVLRRRVPDGGWPYRAPLQPWPALVFLAIALWVAVSSLVSLDPIRLLVPFAVFAAGAIYQIARRRHGNLERR